MCQRAFAPPHAAYRARKRARESYLCKSTLPGTVIATFFRVPTHSRRASRHSIGVKARHRWGSCLYRFHPLCTAKIQTSGAAIRWVPKVPSSMTDILTYCPYRDTKKEPALRSGGISRHCVRVIELGAGGKKSWKKLEFETLRPATNRRCARRACAAGEPSCACSRRVSRGPVRLRARG